MEVEDDTFDVVDRAALLAVPACLIHEIDADEESEEELEATDEHLEKRLDSFVNQREGEEPAVRRRPADEECYVAVIGCITFHLPLLGCFY